MQYNLTRRRFIKRSSSFGALGYASALGLGQLVASPQAMASSGDFKALVFIFLAGGNDSFNMIAPKGAGDLRDRYEAGRRNVALAEADLHTLSLRSNAQIFGGESYDAFGMHPQCADMAAMFNASEMATVCNIGNLVEPTTRPTYLGNNVTLPPQLFSHADQQRQFQSEPLSPFRFGWGGRVAEMLTAFNPGVGVSPLISVSGLNSFQVSRDSVINPYVMRNTGVTNLNGLSGARRTMVESIMSSDSSHLMEEKYRAIFGSAQTASVIVNSAFDIADANGVDYDAIFSATGADETSVGRQLRTVAKMIAGRASSGNNRPIYFVEMGGFDTHQNILPDHQQLMTDLNGALKSFRDALVAQDDFDCTLSYVGSEFGRTFTPNGDDNTAGTDHAWGGHALLLGGMIEGGHFYGTHPDLQLGQGLDADNSRGRWIPTTSTSQVSAVVADWFGVPRSDLNQIFPTLDNFPSPFETEANLAFVKAGV